MIPSNHGILKRWANSPIRINPAKLHIFFYYQREFYNFAKEKTDISPYLFKTHIFMKKSILSLILLSIGISSSYAADFFSTEKSEQTFNLGFRLGVNTSNRTVAKKAIEGYNVQSWGTGFDLGFTADLNFRDYISVQPGLFFESRSGNYTFVSPLTSITGESVTAMQAGHLRSYALTIPIVGSLHFNITDDIRWNVDFGPYVSFLLGSNLKDKVMQYTGLFTDGQVFSQKPASVDFGLKIGTGLQILDHYYVGVHYMAGLNGAWKDLKLDQNTIRDFGGHTKAWVFTIGYDF